MSLRCGSFFELRSQTLAFIPNNGALRLVWAAIAARIAREGVYLYTGLQLIHVAALPAQARKAKT